MSRYTVTVTRAETRALEIEVEADTKFAAKKRALAEAGDHAFPSAPTAEYDVESVSDVTR